MMAKRPFYSAKKINELRGAAQFYKLDAPAEFWTKTADELKYACNGAGPERWSDLKREALTHALIAYEPAFAIHDVEYEWHIGDQRTADKRLKHNMVKIWRKNYGIFRWFTRYGRIERLVVIPAIYAAVAIAGSRAWEDAANE